MEDDRIAGELQVTRNPQCLIATVAKQASLTRRLRCSVSFTSGVIVPARAAYSHSASVSKR